MNTYALLVVQARPEDVDVLIGRLTLLGAEGIEERDASTLTRGGELGATLVASFPDEALADLARDALGGDHPVRREVLLGDAWRDAWKAHWQPFHLTDSVVVVPSWLTYHALPGEQLLPLDPGRAFGTGQHATTALAARAIARRIVVQKPTLLVDVGTGSGILAFTAALLGVPRAVGCDNDPDAVSAARENAERMSFAGGVEFRVGGPEALSERAPLVVANIEAAVLVPLAEALASRVLPGGALVLSGVLATQREAVVEAYTRLGFTLERCDAEDEWVAPELRAP
ncbi:MAG: 50S ribosomal protein L11 methyltransferase [Deltaproteobacteria bacterium]|nr:50S ribosomal protein L11 methyltransferase [Deltaproteobacteria bacterium]